MGRRRRNAQVDTGYNRSSETFQVVSMLLSWTDPLIPFILSSWRFEKPLMLMPQVPQLIENYRGQNAEGISLKFLGIWMLGDLTNLLGALYGGLYVQVTSLTNVVHFLLNPLRRSECIAS